MQYILVVDDEEINREILEDMLEDSYEVLSVGNGKECLFEIGKRLPDLLVLDVGLPDMNGLDICSKLKSDAKTKKLPIILSSGFASPEDVNKGIEAGCEEYITKPFNIDYFLERISYFINLKT